MRDIFVSYATKDRPRAQIFARALEAHGWSVFWDRTIRAGGTWRETIGKELQNARCVLVLWSKESTQSDWVQEEADVAKGRHVLLPVLTDHILPPIGFRSVQCADLSDWDGSVEAPTFQRLIADIVALIGPPLKQAENAVDGAREVDEEWKQSEVRPASAMGLLAPAADAAPSLWKKSKWPVAGFVSVVALAGAAYLATRNPVALSVSPPISEKNSAVEKAEDPRPDAAASLAKAGEAGAGVSPVAVGPAKLPVDKDFARRQANLGLSREKGLNGLPSDEAEAARLYKQAADQGDAMGQARLGYFYEAGLGGLPRNQGEAARLYKLAADQGDATAQAHLGFFYERGWGGLPKDEREAARLFKLSADQGDAMGQAHLGFFYQTGEGGLPRDEREAARLFKLSADQGDAMGQAHLGLFYERGMGGLPKNASEAARLYKLAAAQGAPMGQARLGFFYELGLGGLPKNVKEAKRLYSLAAEQGNEFAMARLKKM